MDHENKTNKPFAVMFHHFWGKYEHKYIQGALKAEEFESLLTNSGKYKFLSAEVWLEKLKSRNLNQFETCVTFDDSLLSQYEIARPVLEKLNIRAFWFIYSSACKGNGDPFEVYRYFRNLAFAEIDSFHDCFFRYLEKIISEKEILKLQNSRKAQNHLKSILFIQGKREFFVISETRY